MTKRWARISFAAGFLLGLLFYWRYGGDSLRIVTVVVAIVWALLWALRHVAATDTQMNIGRFGASVSGGFVMAAFATLLVMIALGAMGRY